MSNREVFYTNLKEKLEETTTFPGKYLYKFIVPTAESEVKKVQDLFDQEGAVINTRKSRSGKYTSISIHMNVSNVDEVILYYRKAEKIKSIISL